MRRTFHLSAVITAIILGSVFVLGLGIISGSFYATPRLPIMAVISGFVITGIIVGWITKEETIIEPGFSSFIVAIIGYIVFQSMELKGFLDLSRSDLALVLCNGILLTFAGAWAGEQLQGDSEEKTTLSIKVEWPWIVCGTTVGITVSVVLISSIVVWLGAHMQLLLYAFLLGLLFTGFLMGLRSPSSTLLESALAGFLTVILSIDIVIVTLVPVNGRVKLGGVIVGLLVAMIGGYIGERVQKLKSAS